MKRSLTFTLALVFAGAAAAQDEARPAYDLYCSATHEIACGADLCEREAGDAIHVNLSLVTGSGAGNLCTYTYCRDFMLTPNPGETVEQAVESWTGFTLSQSRGSTEEHINRPAIDYQLSISDDRTRFVLGGAANGRFAGWAGSCRSYADD